MKKYFLFITFFIAAIGLYAQDCNSYFPMKEGARFEYENRDKRDKTVGNFDYVIKKIQSKSGGYEITIASSFTEGKKKPVHTQEFKAMCKDGALSIDFESLFPPHLKESFADADYKITGTNMDWPSSFRVGEKLPDSDMTMTLSMGGMSMNIGMKVMNRKVDRKEKITTPAGTFDTYVITYDTQTDTMGQKITSSTIQWVSPGIGMIKTEDYSKGKLEASTVLMSYQL